MRRREGAGEDTMTDERVLTLWVIYESPSDYPGKFVVRRQHSTRRAVVIDLEAWVFDSMAEARTAIPEGLYNTGRYDMDDSAAGRQSR